MTVESGTLRVVKQRTTRKQAELIMGLTVGLGFSGIGWTAAPKAARMVQLYYDAAPGTMYYQEVVPRESAPGTYFCAIGFEQGYLGLQELGSSSNRIALFSLWDAAGGKPTKTNRIELISQHPEAKIESLEGEPPGLQCAVPVAWQVNETYRFLVTAATEVQHTVYAAYMQDARHTNQWLHLASFRSPVTFTPISGYYSFIEDFQRNGKSAGLRRWAAYGNGWVRTKDQVWLPLTHATFEGEAVPLPNVDAGPAGEPGWYFLGTGGSVTNVTTKLKGRIDIPAASRSEPPWIRSFNPADRNAFASLGVNRPPPAPLFAPGQVPAEPPDTRLALPEEKLKSESARPEKEGSKNQNQNQDKDTGPVLKKPAKE